MNCSSLRCLYRYHRLMLIQCSYSPEDQTYLQIFHHLRTMQKFPFFEFFETLIQLFVSFRLLVFFIDRKFSFKLTARLVFGLLYKFFWHANLKYSLLFFLLRSFVLLFQVAIYRYRYFLEGLRSQLEVYLSAVLHISFFL